MQRLGTDLHESVIFPGKVNKMCSNGLKEVAKHSPGPSHLRGNKHIFSASMARLECFLHLCVFAMNWGHHSCLFSDFCNSFAKDVCLRREGLVADLVTSIHLPCCLEFLMDLSPHMEGAKLRAQSCCSAAFRPGHLDQDPSPPELSKLHRL